MFSSREGGKGWNERQREGRGRKEKGKGKDEVCGSSSKKLGSNYDMVIKAVK